MTHVEKGCLALSFNDEYRARQEYDLNWQKKKTPPPRALATWRHQAEQLFQRKRHNNTVAFSKHDFEKIMKSMDIVESRVNDVSTAPCYLWKNMHGRFFHERKWQRVQRLVFKYCLGEALRISQHCPLDRICLQPQHIFAATQKMNFDETESIISEAPAIPGSPIFFNEPIFQEKTVFEKSLFKTYACEKDQDPLGSDFVFKGGAIGVGSPDG